MKSLQAPLRWQVHAGGQGFWQAPTMGCRLGPPWGLYLCLSATEAERPLPAVLHLRLQSKILTIYNNGILKFPVKMCRSGKEQMGGGNGGVNRRTRWRRELLGRGAAASAELSSLSIQGRISKLHKRNLQKLLYNSENNTFSNITGPGRSVWVEKRKKTSFWEWSLLFHFFKEVILAGG